MAGVGSQPVSTSALLSLLFLTNRKKKKSHKTLLSPWLDGSATSSGLQGDLLWTKERTILLWMDSDRSEGWFDWNTENLYLSFFETHNSWLNLSLSFLPSEKVATRMLQGCTPLQICAIDTTKGCRNTLCWYGLAGYSIAVFHIGCVSTSSSNLCILV